MKIKYLSHAAFLLTGGGATVAIDPFLNGNPNAPMKPDDVAADYIVVTHAHADHMGDTLAIAKANGAMVISTAEVAGYCQSMGVRAHPLHIGGGRDFSFGRVKLTIAHHGSSLPVNGAIVNIGVACGALVTMGGKTVYHCGDTGLFLDMKLIGEMNGIDAALLPIGDNYTMGMDDAVKAVEFINPALAIPMHYGTFDEINADPNEFAHRVYKLGKKARVLAFGEEIEI
jgi:L-ascorbate metabolism protein UlaG (beta-lactamase superfamily)